MHLLQAPALLHLLRDHLDGQVGRDRQLRQLSILLAPPPLLCRSEPTQMLVIVPSSEISLIVLAYLGSESL